MLVFALALAAGVVAGLARGGRLGRLGSLVLHRPALVWAAIALQLALGSRLTRGLPSGARFGIVVASYGLGGAWLVLNAVRHRRALRAAFGLLAAGWLLNVAAILPNGGMPVSQWAHEASGSPGGASVSDGHLWKHVPATRETILRPLGDVIPVRPLGAVVSAGDLLLLAGVALLVAGALAPAREPAPPGHEPAGREPPVPAQRGPRDPG